MKKMKSMSRGDMNEGWRKLAQDMKGSKGYDLSGKSPKIGEYSSPRAGKPGKPDEYGMNFPDTWGVKKQKPLMATGQKPFMVTGQKPLEDRRDEEREEEVWSSDDWENWAFQIYKEYPEMKKYLPDWFIEEVEKEIKQ